MGSRTPLRAVLEALCRCDDRGEKGYERGPSRINWLCRRVKPHTIVQGRTPPDWEFIAHSPLSKVVPVTVAQLVVHPVVTRKVVGASPICDVYDQAQ